MKKHTFPYLSLVSLVFLCLTTGVFLGRNLNGGDLVISLPEDMQTQPPPPAETSPFPINLNTATREELTALPGIGDVLALRIHAYRLSRGKLTSLEDLYEVDGIGEATLARIRDLVYIGG